MKRLSARILLLLLCIAPMTALAADGYLNANANLRAGPGSEYPRIIRLPSGLRVEIVGCVDDWAWCDVITGRDRGWVSSQFLEYTYQDRRVVVYGHGSSIGLPLITFVFGTYWDNYYRDRPWYRDRVRWSHYHPVRPSRPIVKPMPPVRPIVKPTRPIRPIVKPTHPVRPIVKPTRPIRPIVKPIRPIRPIVKPARPVKPVVRPRSDVITKPTPVKQ